jgi:hypothetical protein
MGGSHSVRCVLSCPLDATWSYSPPWDERFGSGEKPQVLGGIEAPISKPASSSDSSIWADSFLGFDVLICQMG